jgi:anti-sigma regulatory factor (Ser/Thr protein kinase)
MNAPPAPSWNSPGPMGGLLRTEFNGKTLHLVLGNTLGSVLDGRREIQRYYELRLYDPKVVNRLDVIFEELVSNILRHGFTPGSGQSIAVFVCDRPGLIELTLEDDGTPFNPLAASEPAPLHNIETARIGGLGISLVRKLAADVRYERPATGAGGFVPTNRVIVTLAT